MALPFKVEWKLSRLLEKEGITVYRLEQTLAHKVSRGTLYRWAREQPQNPNLEGIGWILWGLKELTGKQFTVVDILEYEMA